MSHKGDTARRAAIRDRNREELGPVYDAIEALAHHSKMPPWPVKQCTAKAKNTQKRCRNRLASPGAILCRYHFGATVRNRKIAMRRFAVWALCGFPFTDDGLLEALVAFAVEELLKGKAFYEEVPLEVQVNFFTALLTEIPYGR